MKSTELQEIYWRLSDREKAIVSTAAQDSDQAKRLSIARLYFPGAPDADLTELLGHLRRPGTPS